MGMEGDWAAPPPSSPSGYGYGPSAPYSAPAWDRTADPGRRRDGGGGRRRPSAPPRPEGDAFARAGYSATGLPFKLPDLGRFFEMGTEDVEYDAYGRGAPPPPQPGFGVNAPPPPASSYPGSSPGPQGAPWDYPAGPRANVTLLTKDERIKVLPPFYAPLGSQYDFFR